MTAYIDAECKNAVPQTLLTMDGTCKPAFGMGIQGKCVTNSGGATATTTMTPATSTAAPASTTSRPASAGKVAGSLAGAVIAVVVAVAAI